MGRERFPTNLGDMLFHLRICFRAASWIEDDGVSTVWTRVQFGLRISDKLRMHSFIFGSQTGVIRSVGRKGKGSTSYGPKYMFVVGCGVASSQLRMLA